MSKIEPDRASEVARNCVIAAARASQVARGSQIEPARASQGAQGRQIEPARASQVVQLVARSSAVFQLGKRRWVISL